MRVAKVYLTALMALPVAVFSQEQPSQHESPQHESAEHDSAQHDSAQYESAQHESAQGQSKLAEGETSSSCIGHFTFSHEFLSRYPDAGGACREVKVQDGHKWARFDADVVRVQSNQLTANFVDRHDRNLGTITFDASPDFRVDMDGRQTRVSALRPGDKLSFWMPEDRAGFYAGPQALDSDKLAVVDTAPARR